MCGIWGFLGMDESVDVPDAWAGLSSLTDRGPDDWGMYLNGEKKVTRQDDFPEGERATVLGNRRLSILDLSEAGNQPMSSADGTRWIVYNGEIYNYREIRNDLRDHGYEFESDTDTEVVLKAYDMYGAECVEQFRGMFAFGIYDESHDSLFAARDRFGIKPFYFGHGTDRFTFASELTSLLTAGVVSPTLDPISVDGFLTFGYVPGSRTILEGVRELPSGSTLEFDRSTGTCDINSYWSPDFGGEENPNIDRIRELLEESVRLRLRSDVPVGAFLSGGLDSSTIVALMQALGSSDAEPTHTFSIGFDHEEYTETDHAETVAEAFGTKHTSEVVTAEDVRAELDDIVEAMDQPTIDGVNTYFVSKVTAENGLKVALSGLGSDELLYGYPTFQQVDRWSRAARTLYAIPGPVRRYASRGIDFCGSLVSAPGMRKAADAMRSDYPFGAAYVTARGLFTRSQRQTVLDASVETLDWTKRITEEVDETAHGDSREGVSYAELRWYMQWQLLRDTDSMSMSQSLEVRVPFLDTALAEYLIGVAPASKAVGEKDLLKEVMGEQVPLETLERDKSGFTFPFAEWLRDELEDVVKESLTAEALDETPISPEGASHVRRAFEEGDEHWSRVWALVVLSRWIDTHT